MRLPFKVSTTTSNFTIGVTAAASAGVYLNRGYIDPGLTMPVVLGVLPGAMLGARLSSRAFAELPFESGHGFRKVLASLPGSGHWAGWPQTLEYLE